MDTGVLPSERLVWQQATVDRIGYERHALAGLAKDLGSAAVFMSFVLLGAVWLLVLLDR